MGVDVGVGVVVSISESAQPVINRDKGKAIPRMRTMIRLMLISSLDFLSFPL